ncbi:MAG: hypothetical protein GXP26_17735 [Planctomycetes bacterium]|nr:hypothetical protein [Planctomycetota bacterium]
MPSYRVSESTTPLKLLIFDVVGRDGKETGFVDHAGLTESTGTHETRKIPILHMRPPLHGRRDPEHMKVSVVGSATLTDDEVHKIRTFVDLHDGEHSAFLQLSRSGLIRATSEMYCVRPHASPLREADGRYARTRFSCAGFVFEAYKRARIELLDPNALPMVDMADIKLAYPDYERLMENERISSEDLGLDGSGPWPVLLCGYLFHALDRDAEAIRNHPYTPIAANRFFL